MDPIGIAGGINVYAYAHNNPVRYADPPGLCDTCPCSGAHNGTGDNGTGNGDNPPYPAPYQDPGMWPLTLGPNGYSFNGDYSGAVEFEKQVVGLFIPEGPASKAWELLNSIFDFEPSAY